MIKTDCDEEYTINSDYYLDVQMVGTTVKEFLRQYQLDYEEQENNKTDQRVNHRTGTSNSSSATLNT